MMFSVTLPVAESARCRSTPHMLYRNSETKNSTIRNEASRLVVLGRTYLICL